MTIDQRQRQWQQRWRQIILTISQYYPNKQINKQCCHVNQWTNSNHLKWLWWWSSSMDDNDGTHICGVSACGLSMYDVYVGGQILSFWSNLLQVRRQNFLSFFSETEKEENP